MMNKGSKEESKGFYIDTGANRIQTMLLAQYKAYNIKFGQFTGIKPEARGVHGIEEKLHIIGVVSIKLLFKKLTLKTYIDFTLME